MLKKKNKDLENKLIELIKKVDELRGNKITNSFNNINSNNTITNNITIVPYNKVSPDILSEKKKIEIVNQGHDSLIALLEALHFDPKHPENHSLYKTNINNSIVYVYSNKEKTYIIENCQNVITELSEKLVDDLEDIKEDVYDKAREKYVKCTEKLISNMRGESNDDSIEEIKRIKEYKAKKQKDMVNTIINKSQSLELSNKNKVP
jgi:hypothetical protein